MIDDPGEMRQRGVLQDLSIVEDEGGGRVEAWAAVFPTSCKVESLAGNEQLNAMAVELQAPHRITFRYRAGVTSRHRFLELHPDGDRIHEITSVRDVDGKRSWLELLTDVVP